jgi:hypothetical protein
MALVAANAVTRKVAMEKVTGARLRLRPKKLLKRLKMVPSLKLSPREESASPERSNPSPSQLLKRKLVSLLMTTSTKRRLKNRVSLRRMKVVDTRSLRLRTSRNLMFTTTKEPQQLSRIFPLAKPTLLSQMLEVNYLVSKTPKTMRRSSQDVAAEAAVEVVVAKDAVPKGPRPSVVVARVAKLSWTTTNSQLYEK